MRSSAASSDAEHGAVIQRLGGPLCLLLALDAMEAIEPSLRGGLVCGGVGCAVRFRRLPQDRQVTVHWGQ
ncbi:hypothetical protein ACWEKJ_25865 [Amycolatopsis thermoflava]